VDEVDAHVPYKRRELLRATADLAHWAAHRDVELTHATVFTDHVIDGFIRDGLPNWSDASRANMRSQLRRMRDVLHGADAPTPERLAGAAAQAPYTKAALKQFSDWAARQKTPEFRRDARTILALGLGAGLTASEIGNVRQQDIIEDPLGFQVAVRGTRERVVQILRAQEERIRNAVEAAQQGQYLIRPQRTGNPQNLISNIVDRGAASELGPQSQRMRTTWLVYHLNAGTRLGVLMTAAGLESLKALGRVLPFADEVAVGDARRALRG
jgi:integrase